jgi:phage-related protein
MIIFHSFVIFKVSGINNKLYASILFCKKMLKRNICNILSNFSKIMSILYDISTLHTGLSTVSSLISCTFQNYTHIIHRQFSTINFIIPTLLTLFQHFIHNIFDLFLNPDKHLRIMLKFFLLYTQNNLHMQSLHRYLYTIYSLDSKV